VFSSGTTDFREPFSIPSTTDRCCCTKQNGRIDYSAILSLIECPQRDYDTSDECTNESSKVEVHVYCSANVHAMHIDKFNRLFLDRKHYKNAFYSMRTCLFILRSLSATARDGTVSCKSSSSKTKTQTNSENTDVVDIRFISLEMQSRRSVFTLAPCNGRVTYRLSVARLYLPKSSRSDNRQVNFHN
jgi:hypothetical protein